MGQGTSTPGKAPANNSPHAWSAISRSSPGCKAYTRIPHTHDQPSRTQNRAHSPQPTLIPLPAAMAVHMTRSLQPATHMSHTAGLGWGETVCSTPLLLLSVEHRTSGLQVKQSLAQDEIAGLAEAVGAASSPAYLLAPGVKHFFHFPPGLRHVALLQEGEIVWVLQGDLQLPILRFLQGVQEVLRQPRWGEEDRKMQLTARSCHPGTTQTLPTTVLCSFPGTNQLLKDCMQV